MGICNRNRIMTGVRFLFRVTLRRLDLAAEIYHLREPQKIAQVMSPGRDAEANTPFEKLPGTQINVPRLNLHKRPRHRRCPTSRDFVPWRFSDAGRRSAWIASSCRHPKTYTGRDSCTAQQKLSLFDQFVGPVEKRFRNCDAECVGGLKIDQEFEFCRLLDGNFSGPGAFQYLVDVDGGTAADCNIVDAIGNQCALLQRFSAKRGQR